MHSEPQDTQQETKGALDGLVVLDLSRILAGPTATQMLGDLGANVYKIENPKTGGDDTRAWGPPYAEQTNGNQDLSAYFMAANRNKFSIPADLSTQEGRDLVVAIASQADVLIENYKPDGLVKYGLDYNTLSQINPKLVYCSISGFGQTGPNRDLPGYDIMAQGFGGIMSLTGEPEGKPMKVGVGIADVMCGMYATIGILAALRHRDATGEGQHIDLALVDAQMAWLVNEGVNCLTSGAVPQRRGNGHPNIAPYDVYECEDGFAIMAVGNDNQFIRFCEVLGCSQLPSDPRFKTNPDRIVHRDALNEILEPLLKTYPKDQLLAKLQAQKVPCGPINDLKESLHSEQAKARESVIEMAHENATKGSVSLLGNPLKFSKTPVTYRRPPPVFGQDLNVLSEHFPAQFKAK